MGTVIDELFVRLGLDTTGYKKGRAEAKAGLDEMRKEAAQAQTAINAIQAKAARQKKQHAAEERAIQNQIAQLNRTTVDATSAAHNREIKALRAELTEKRAANRQARQITENEIAQQKKILATKQQGRKDTERSEKDQAHEARKRIQQTREEGAAVQGLTAKIIGLFAAFTAGEGVASFMKNTFEGAAATGRLAENLGVDIEALGAWEGAVKRVGGAAADADGALASLVKTRELIRAGQLPGDQAKVLNSFGVTAQDLNDPIATLEKLASRASTMSKAQFSLRLGMLGFDQNAINALENGGEALRKLMDEARASGVVTKEQAERSQRVVRAWESMKASSATLGRELLDRLAPAIETVARWLERLAIWGQEHPDAMAAGIAAITVALLGLAAISLAPIIAGLVETAAALWPFIAAAAAAGVAVKWLADDFAEFEKTGKSAIDWGPFVAIWEQLKTAMEGVADAAQEVVDALPPEAWEEISGALKVFGAILETVVLGNLYLLLGVFHLIRDELKLIADILNGDWGSAWKDAGQVVLDFVDIITAPLRGAAELIKDVWYAATHHGAARPRETAAAPAPGTGAGIGFGLRGIPGNAEPARSAAPPSPGGSAVDQASALLRRFEAYRPNAYWDVNAYRAGYGSDTTTDPRTGKVTRVTAGTSGVTREMAEADLQRRIRTEYLPRARASVGAQQWDALPESTKAAILSTTYNYGTTPGSVANAAKRGDTAGVARAIEGLKGHNRGINAARRAQEAAYVRGGSNAADSTPAPARSAVPATTPARAAPRSSPPVVAGSSGGNWVLHRKTPARSAATTPSSPSRASGQPATPAPAGAPITEPLPTPSPPTPASAPVIPVAAPDSAEPSTMVQAANTLLSAAHALLQAATAMRGSGMPARYDRGLNVGSSVSYAHHVISNDNSQRSESSTHIGQVNVQGSNAGQIWRGLEDRLRTRGLAYNAASGLSQ